MTTNAKQDREQHNQAPGAVSAGQVNAWIGNPSPVCIHAKQCGRSVVVEHNGDSGLGARYTRSRRPVTLAYVEPARDRAEAARREAAIKQLDRARKLALCKPNS